MTVTIEAALAALEALADPAKAAEMAAYHKSTRRFFGVTVPQIDDLAAEEQVSFQVAGIGNQ